MAYNPPLIKRFRDGEMSREKFFEILLSDLQTKDGKIRRLVASMSTEIDVNCFFGESTKNVDVERAYTDEIIRVALG